MPRPPHPQKDTVTPLLAERIHSVFRRLPKALTGDEESIHQMRVAGRRLRVALPVLARKPEGRRVTRARALLRQLTRGAGRSRDLDVMCALFDERLAALGKRTPERTVLRRRMRSALGRSRAQMAEDLMDLEIARLRRDLRAIISRGGEGLFVVLGRLRRTRDVGGAALLSAFDALGGRFDPEALHRLRIRARRLRYAAELFDGLRGEVGPAPKLFEGLQEQLGKIHDTHVLVGWLGRQASVAEARGGPSLAAEARRLEGTFLAESRGHHRTFLLADPADIVRRALAAMGRAISAA